jgi:hypothetical protein
MLQLNIEIHVFNAVFDWCSFPTICLPGSAIDRMQEYMSADRQVLLIFDSKRQERLVVVGKSYTKMEEKKCADREREREVVFCFHTIMHVTTVANSSDQLIMLKK